MGVVAPYNHDCDRPLRESLTRSAAVHAARWPPGLVLTILTCHLLMAFYVESCQLPVYNCVI